MASTYSTNLALELITTGEQSGTWGTTTNTNLGTLIEQAISGYVTQAITDGADTTITIPNGATGVARNMYIECTGALTNNRNLVVPSNKKLYFIYNNTTGGFAVTVKVSGQTGVSVPNGKKVVLVSNGTDIVSAENYIASLSLGSALPVASGGTGLTSYTANGVVYASGTTTLASGSVFVFDGTNVGINQSSPGSRLDVKGTLRLSGSSSGYVGLAPAAAAGSTTYTLPSADGTSGQFLSTNGSATLSWVSQTAAATQSDQETSTSTSTYVSPGRQQYHPSAAKVWASVNQTGTQAIRVSYNVSSVTDGGTGVTTLNLTTAFSTADYAAFCNTYAPGGGGTPIIGSINGTPTASTFKLFSVDIDGFTVDSAYVYGVAFGDQ